jgi:uncharacterized membrane protein YgaE (UPF0421/DUF939 family)
MSATTLTRAADGGLAAARRLRAVLWPIIQTAVAAALAWYVTHDLLGEPQPFFAPTTAVVCLSATNLLRARRAGQMIVGVALGIVLGEQAQILLGTGTVAVGVAVLGTLCIAVLIGRGFFAQGLTFFNQTATSAVLVLAVPHSGRVATERIVDVLIGGGLALVFSMLLFPANPAVVLRNARAGVLAALHDILAQVASMMSEPIDATNRHHLSVDRLHHQLGRLIEARTTARLVTQRAPRRWAERSAIREADQHAANLGLLAACVLHLARAVPRSLADWHPAPLHDAIVDLAAGTALADMDRVSATAHAAAARDHAAALQPFATTRTQTVLADILQACVDDLQRVIDCP